MNGRPAIETNGMTFAEARARYISRIATLPLRELDAFHFIMGDAVLNMAYRMDNHLVQEVPRENSSDFVVIDADTEEGLIIVLTLTVEELDARHAKLRQNE